MSAPSFHWPSVLSSSLREECAGSVASLLSFTDHFVLSYLSHLPGRTYCVYHVHYVCDMHKHLLLSGRGGKHLNVRLDSTIFLSG